eukprot:3243009-Rhodomonas_salina.1
MRVTCRECNPNHDFYGIPYTANFGPDGKQRGSSFEHKMLEALARATPVGTDQKEQFHVELPSRPKARVDARVAMPCNTVFFIEMDGSQHYVYGQDSRINYNVQFQRDRELEDHCLKKNISLFRVPDSLKSNQKCKLAM